MLISERRPVLRLQDRGLGLMRNAVDQLSTTALSLASQASQAVLRKRADHAALVVDRHRLQNSGRKAVLLKRIDLHVAMASAN